MLLSCVGIQKELDEENRIRGVDQTAEQQIHTRLVTWQFSESNFFLMISILEQTGL